MESDSVPEATSVPENASASETASTSGVDSWATVAKEVARKQATPLVADRRFAVAGNTAAFE